MVPRSTPCHGHLIDLEQPEIVAYQTSVGRVILYRTNTDMFALMMSGGVVQVIKTFVSLGS